MVPVVVNGGIMERGTNLHLAEEGGGVGARRVGLRLLLLAVASSKVAKRSTAARVLVEDHDAGGASGTKTTGGSWLGK